jgi:hypothetical protein
MLIDQQASDTFDPSVYTDEVSARIGLRCRKVEGPESAAEAPEGGRAGHRSHGSAAREPREEGGRPFQGRGQPAGRASRKRAEGTRRGAGGAPARQARVSHAQRFDGGVRRDVEKLLHLSRSTIRSLIAAGFVAPARGARNAWLFTFQDLIVLRTAQALAEAKVPQRRITRSLKELRCHLPDAMPLSGLSICAVADRVVIRERGHWQADSGQYLLEFEGVGGRLHERHRKN